MVSKKRMIKSKADELRSFGRLFNEATPSNRITTLIGKTTPYIRLMAFESITALSIVSTPIIETNAKVIMESSL